MTEEWVLVPAKLDHMNREHNAMVSAAYASLRQYRVGGYLDMPMVSDAIVAAIAARPSPPASGEEGFRELIIQAMERCDHCIAREPMADDDTSDMFVGYLSRDSLDWLASALSRSAPPAQPIPMAHVARDVMARFPKIRERLRETDDSPPAQEPAGRWNNLPPVPGPHVGRIDIPTPPPALVTAARALLAKLDRTITDAEYSPIREEAKALRLALHPSPTAEGGEEPADGRLAGSNTEGGAGAAVSPSTEPRSLVLLKIEPTNGAFYAVLSAYGEATKETSLDEYMYDEGTCPTNWTRDIIALIEDGDTDPHGIGTFVRRASFPTITVDGEDFQMNRRGHFMLGPGRGWEPQRVWREVFPEAFVPPTPSDRLDPGVRARLESWAAHIERHRHLIVHNTDLRTALALIDRLSGRGA